MRTLFALALLAAASAAQSPQTHAVTLTWQDTLNPSGTTYSIYRATGLCSGSPAFAKIATAVAAKNYEDTTVQPGNYCYQVTATYNAVESAPSNQAMAPVPAFAPTQLSISVR